VAVLDLVAVIIKIEIVELAEVIGPEEMIRDLVVMVEGVSQTAMEKEVIDLEEKMMAIEKAGTGLEEAMTINLVKVAAIDLEEMISAGMKMAVTDPGEREATDKMVIQNGGQALVKIEDQEGQGQIPVIK